MKTLLFTFLFLQVTNITYSQSNFSEGYTIGFKEGYCFDDFGCIAPVAPIAPVPKVGESFRSYIDGYNRGLLDGVNAKKVSSRVEYFNQHQKNQQSFPEIIIYQPNWNLLERLYSKTDENRQAYIDKNSQFNKQQIDIDNFLEEQWEKYFSEEAITQTKGYALFLKNYLENMKHTPNTYPNGWYTAKISTYNVNDLDSSDSGYFFENKFVYVENNIVVATCDSFAQDGSYYWLSEKAQPNFKSFMRNDGGQIYSWILEAEEINKGIGIIFEETYHRSSSGSYYTNEQLAGRPSKPIRLYIYMIDYLTYWNDAQECILETKKRYNDKNSFNTFSDGWQKGYANDGNIFCDIREVYIKENKIILYKDGQGINRNILSGGEITNNQTKITYLGEYNGEKKNMELTVYFL